MEDKGKRGSLLVGLLFIILAGLMLMIIMGLMVFGFDLVDDSLSEIDFQLGNVTFNQTYEQILKPGIVSAKTTMPRLMSISILLGMVLVMIISGFLSKKIGRYWILLDLLVLIIAEFLAVIVKDSFTSFINSSPQMLEIFSTTLAPASKFMLNLPTIIPTVGVLTMIATYYITKEKDPRTPF